MSKIEIILGPTNTGKTFYAFEQMFTYKNGVFGFPLRLLARENYDKACKLYPINQIALITGEEKILPKDAKYFFCTVESMPESSFEFLCVDEIQLSSDYERGHIFTQRLLYSRGEQKSIFLGSLTMEDIIRELIPEADIKFKNRFSQGIPNEVGWRYAKLATGSVSLVWRERRHKNEATDSDFDSILLAFFLVKVP